MALLSQMPQTAPIVKVVPRVSLEREIKLSVPRGFHLPAGLGELLPARTLTSTYVDTADHRLAEAGITLRRRVEGRHRGWQLKIPVEEGRKEIEIEGGGETPPAAFTDLLLVHLRDEGIFPVAKLRTRRRVARVTEDGGCADISIDAVSVLHGRRVLHSFREIEIELVEGAPALLTRLDQELRRAGADDHDGRPKLFRALGLSPHAPVFPVPAEAPLREHVKSALAGQLASLVGYDPLTRLGTDQDAVHGMRVATRRARAILRTIKPIAMPEWVDPLRAELNWLGTFLGPARDLDVQIEYFGGEAERLEPRDRVSVERFIDGLRRDRMKAQQELQEQLRSKRYLGLIDELRRAGSEPCLLDSSLSLRDLAAAEYRKLRKCIRALPVQPRDAVLHRLRIKAKRARYAAELAAGVVGKQAWQFIECTKELQDVLGTHQDAVVAEGRVRAYLDQAKGVRAAFAAGQMVERQRHRRAAARAQLGRLCKKVMKRGKKAWA